MLDLQTEKYFWLGTHEPIVQDWLVERVKPGWTTYDIGAHLGYFTLALSRLVGESGHVYAFEPDPTNLQRLQDNLALNGSCNVSIVPLAVTKQEGVVRFQRGRETMSHVLQPGSNEPLEPTEIIPTSAVSLDAFVLAHRHTAPQLIKIDVEGHEGAVLSGAREVLRMFRPLVICEVHNACAADAVWDALQSASYRVLRLDDENQSSHRRREAAPDPVYGHVLGLPQ